MSGATLRPVRDGDAAAIADLFNQQGVIAGTLRLPYTPEKGVAQWLDGLGPRARMVVAEAEGRAVGFIILTRFEGRMAHSGDLFIAVHDGWHGQGIGGALMAAALDIADNWMGLVRVQLEVMVANAAAVRLYERHGFRIEGRARAGTLVDGELADHYYMARLRAAPGRRKDDEEANP